MNGIDLPPLPAPEEQGQRVCAIIRLYMAVMQDLTTEQRAVVSAHIHNCADCAREYLLVDQATNLVAHLPQSAPSAHVDQAVAQAIAARRHAQTTRRRTLQPVLRPTRWLAVAAAFILALATALSLWSGLFTAPTTAFALPANLSWKPYVLYHSQTMMSEHGEPYQVKTYHDLQHNMLNVQTVMDGKLDIMVVQDDHQALGLDMMHHVAQWDAHNWSVNESLFNLDLLRHDLQTGHAVSLGTANFKNQVVYRIRWLNNQILLLDMHYMPVNVVPENGGPVYDTLQWLQPSQVSSSLWDMNVPQGFKMGTLPTKP